MNHVDTFDYTRELSDLKQEGLGHGNLPVAWQPHSLLVFTAWETQACSWKISYRTLGRIYGAPLMIIFNLTTSGMEDLFVLIQRPSPTEPHQSREQGCTL